MTDFSIESGVRIPDREKRDAKRDLQQSIGDVTIDVDAAQSGAGGASTAGLAGGAGALDELSDQTDLLQSISDELEKIGVSGGGGGGGGGGSLLGGTSGVAIGSALTGGGGLLGTVLGKGKSGLGSLLKGRGSITGAIGRSPFTMLSQTAGRRDVSSRAGQGASGPVTGAMSDIATGDFQLKEDFWPDLSPPEDLWNVDLSPPKSLWGFDLSPPNDLWGFDLSPPDNLWNVDLSPPDDLWGIDLSPPDDLWGVDLSPPGDLWGIDLSPPADIWNVDLSPPDDLWPSIKLPTSGIWSALNPNSGDNGRVSEGTQDVRGKTSGPTPGRTSIEGFSPPSSPSNQSSTAASPAPSSAGAEPRIDVVVQEVAARIDRGRALEDALQGALETVTPEIKNEVVAQIQEDMPGRL